MTGHTYNAMGRNSSFQHKVLELGISVILFICYVIVLVVVYKLTLGFYCNTMLPIVVKTHHYYWRTDTASPTDHTNPDEVARRHRHSPWPLQTVEDALSIILSHGTVCPVETVSYKNARGRYLAQAVYAPEPLPPFPASIKDGYAVVGMLLTGNVFGLLTYVCVYLYHISW